VAVPTSLEKEKEQQQPDVVEPAVGTTEGEAELELDV
jgi:hypothetical protein